MKFKWQIQWSDGRVDTGVYAVSLKAAETAVRKEIEFSRFSSPAPVVEEIRFIPCEE